ncbi:YciI family protein [Cytophagaceae bacterium YF14B1]|uniref:YciI family protein n=1 Tax=Xanthocytophaga flava TaxID=3048013 RepID=A0AAE3QYQ7_9BACT|nr:YciI family protein [Xanthocytophaga flavus]MDJ1485681.1 YciI family protein [Xanthocytophaga flavus]
MKDFMLIYRNSLEVEESYAQQSSEAMQASLAKWSAWLGALAQQGKLTDGGQPLYPQGKILKGKAKKVTDGPYIEGKEIVGGYSIIKATDYEEALNLAKGCPVLEDDGLIEVREIIILS